MLPVAEADPVEAMPVSLQCVQALTKHHPTAAVAPRAVWAWQLVQPLEASVCGQMACCWHLGWTWEHEAFLPAETVEEVIAVNCKRAAATGLLIVRDEFRMEELALSPDPSHTALLLCWCLSLVMTSWLRACADPGKEILWQGSEVSLSCADGASKRPSSGPRCA